MNDIHRRRLDAAREIAPREPAWYLEQGLRSRRIRRNGIFLVGLVAAGIAALATFALIYSLGGMPNG